MSPTTVRRSKVASDVCALNEFMNEGKLAVIHMPSIACDIKRALQYQGTVCISMHHLHFLRLASNRRLLLRQTLTGKYCITVRFTGQGDAFD